MFKKFLKKPFFIAEISANHNGNLNNAKKLIYIAKKYGADAVKLQTFTPDSMTLNSDKKYFKIKDGLWRGYNLWKLYDKAKTPLSWHKELFTYARKLKIQIFSTPFDEDSVDFLEKLNCPMYKISSFEMTDIPLIKKVAKTKKPMIISTGLSNIKEISKTYNIARKFGAKNITLLYCVSNYPANVKDFNLTNIEIIKNKFKCRVGFSDHSKDHEIAQMAVTKGADVIEKHIALENQKTGLDIKFSLKGREIKLFREKINKAYYLVEKKFFFRNQKELFNKNFRRSIFSTQNINRGEKFTKNNIKRIRPGIGLSPEYYEKLLNKKSPININANEPLRNIILKKIGLKK